MKVPAFLRRSQVEEDIDEELRSHIQLRTDDLQRSGIPRPEAERRARVEFGGRERFKEEVRETFGTNFLDTLIRDLRFSLRVLRKSPGFTLTAVLTLTLAIGANSVVFGILNALILRPLDVPQAESLYGIERVVDRLGYESYPNYLDLRDRNRSFDDLAAFNVTLVGLDTGDNPSRVWGEQISGNYFDVLHLQPVLGRFLHASDEHGPNSAPYLVLTYSYWQNQFQGDRAVIGRVVQLNKHPFTIIGVAPPGFHGTFLIAAPDLFVPMINQEQLDGETHLKERANRMGVFEIVGHLKPGVTPAQAIADLNSIGSYLEKTYPKEVAHARFNLARPTLYGDFMGNPIRAFVAGLMLLSGLILLAACANLGSLVAARASDRSREMALRLALGARRTRILRTLLTESVLISIAGGALGLWGSVELLRTLSVWQPVPRFPIMLPLYPDANVYGIALLLALASGILFGLVPVRQVLRVDPYQVVKAGSAATARGRITFREILLATQIAICAVLVTSSMVAVRGLMRSLHGNFGFEPDKVLLMNTDPRMGGYSGDAVPAMQKRMIEAMQAVPGVQAVGLVHQPPLYGGGDGARIYSDQTTDLKADNALAVPYLFRISPDYFRAAGTRVLAGRAFSWHDDENAPDVAVVNRQFANKVFGSPSNAVGKYFKRSNGRRVQVVGLVEDGKYFTLAEDPWPAMFVPMRQWPSNETWLVVRSNRDLRQLAPALKNALRDLDPGLPFYIATWNNELAFALFPARMAAVSLGVLGVMGAMLSITGIFGMAAYSVSKRLKELGIRLALGARRKQVLQAALGRALKLLAFGSAAGLILGILASQVLARIVYQATPRDPLVLTGVVLAMALLGLVASWIPAHRALSLDPMKLLREE